jgi:cytoskeletal protein CcmA (bactofilin family)
MEMVASTAADFRPDQENVVYIGAGVTMKGEISVPDLIVVDGTVEGDVTARIVCVGQTGVIRGNIAATEADISGWITDHIEIKQLLIVRSTGRVEGRVMYGEIELEKGAVVTGDLSATDDYRVFSKPGTAAKGVAQERIEAALAAPPAASKAPASADQVEAIRPVRNGAGKGALYVAGEGEQDRRNVLRAPLSIRRASA